MINNVFKFMFLILLIQNNRNFIKFIRSLPKLYNPINTKEPLDYNPNSDKFTNLDELKIPQTNPNNYISFNDIFTNQINYIPNQQTKNDTLNDEEKINPSNNENTKQSIKIDQEKIYKNLKSFLKPEDTCVHKRFINYFQTDNVYKNFDEEMANIINLTKIIANNCLNENKENFSKDMLEYVIMDKLNYFKLVDFFNTIDILNIECIEYKDTFVDLLFKIFINKFKYVNDINYKINYFKDNILNEKVNHYYFNENFTNQFSFFLKNIPHMYTINEDFKFNDLIVWYKLQYNLNVNSNDIIMDFINKVYLKYDENVEKELKNYIKIFVKNTVFNYNILHNISLINKKNESFFLNKEFQIDEDKFHFNEISEFIYTYPNFYKNIIEELDSYDKYINNSMFKSKEFEKLTKEKVKEYFIRDLDNSIYLILIDREFVEKKFVLNTMGMNINLNLNIAGFDKDYINYLIFKHISLDNLFKDTLKEIQYYDYAINGNNNFEIINFNDNLWYRKTIFKLYSNGLFRSYVKVEMIGNEYSEFPRDNYIINYENSIKKLLIILQNYSIYKIKIDEENIIEYILKIMKINKLNLTYFLINKKVDNILLNKIMKNFNFYNKVYSEINADDQSENFIIKIILPILNNMLSLEWKPSCYIKKEDYLLEKIKELDNKNLVELYEKNVRIFNEYLIPKYVKISIILCN